MRRIVVIGNNGSGKSVFSEELGKKLNLPIIHLDRYFYKANWVPVTNTEWDEKVKGFIKGDKWIIDGNYPRTLDVRLKAADTVIFLDLPKWLVLGRVIM